MAQRINRKKATANSDTKAKLNRSQRECFSRIFEGVVLASILSLASHVSGHLELTGWEIVADIIAALGFTIFCMFLRKD
ncbi:MAG: hypothetical protein ORN98_02920 [Alphaproteobacteria bacterium]|nr:hypothetical protein [Alphaproteobacteria bacterium]